MRWGVDDIKFAKNKTLNKMVSIGGACGPLGPHGCEVRADSHWPWCAAQGFRARGIGEPRPPGRSAAELSACRPRPW